MDKAIELITKIINGGAQVADGMSIKTDKILNVTITPDGAGFKVDFLAPEPVFSVTKVITLSNAVDYIKIVGEKAYVKVRSWPLEIPVDLSKME